jgi:uncharacterized protein (DUF433 family)
MNVVDSSGWLEYFADEPNADFFASAIENPKELVVPTIPVYEVFKRVHQQRGENDALKAVAQIIVSNRRICHGKPTFRGARVLFADVLEQVASGKAWVTRVYLPNDSAIRTASSIVRFVSRR